MAHLDLYRLGSLAGEDPALLDDYLTPERIAFVEWPAVAEPALERVAARGAARAPGRRPPADHDRVTLLGIDTSTSASAACVLRDDGESFEVVPRPERLAAGPAHARELMPAVAEVMERAGVGFGELEAIAVGVGPGTLHRAAHRDRDSARARRRRRPDSCGRSRRWPRWRRASTPTLRLPLIDARRGELFAALHAAEGEPIWPPFVAAPERGGASASGRPASACGRPGTGRYDFEGCSRRPE